MSVCRLHYINYITFHKNLYTWECIYFLTFHKNLNTWACIEHDHVLLLGTFRVLLNPL